MRDPSLHATAPLPAGAGERQVDGNDGLRRGLVALPLLGLAAGLAVQALGTPTWAGWIWAVSTLVVLAALLVQVVTSLAKGDVGLDLVAMLSMSGALALWQPLAGIVIAVMYAGGQALEAYAAARAARDMTALLARQPRTALREEADGAREVPVAALAPGDRILVRVGDVLPVDGRVAAGRAVLDQATLTGEALPVRHKAGAAVMSGTVNVGTPFTLRAERPAAESTYAGIVRLVEAARAQKAPMSRLADRYALAFLGFTLVLAGGAWLATGDPLRALAVLVVATPCPLILAVPVAFVAGLSRAAGIGVLIKGSGALEALARVRVLILDKTGTLTRGSVRLAGIAALPPFSAPEVLRLAASLDQASGHPVARALVAEALERGLALATPAEVIEHPGEGIAGSVYGQRVLVGGAGLMQMHGVAVLAGEGPAGSGTVLVAVDGVPAGRLTVVDPLRGDGAGTLTALRARGIARIVLATGDRRPVAERVATGLPIDAVAADQDPAGKGGIVAEERTRGVVMVVGDGVNDAPALAAADLGAALGARGAAAAAEAADVVLLVDSLAPLPRAIDIARRAHAIALQNVWAGLGLSVCGMIAGAFGFLSPLQGALLQEAIDVAVILNALRVLGGGEAAHRTSAPRESGAVEANRRPRGSVP